jgi:hypothetical protein
MKASLFYKIAAVLLVLFAAGHTFGFRQIDPQWGVDRLLATMKSIHFDVQGFSRTYWDFYVGFGLFVSVFMLLAAAVAWQLGGLPGEALAHLKIVRWSLAICFAAVTILSWKYFFMIPVIFSAVITLCLIVAAWLPAKSRKLAGQTLPEEMAARTSQNT